MRPKGIFLHFSHFSKLLSASDIITFKYICLSDWWKIPATLVLIILSLLIFRLNLFSYHYWSLRASLLGQLVCLKWRKPGFDPWVGKILWRKQWQPTPVSLPGKSHWQRSLVDCSPWGRRVGHDRATITHSLTGHLHFLLKHACQMSSNLYFDL